MKFIHGDYFSLDLDMFDGIITDIPYKGAIPGKLGEDQFDFARFIKKASNEIKTDGFLVSFVNFTCAIDLVTIARHEGFKYKCYQIWDKRPTRSWVSWGQPPRITEFIVYFTRGNYRFDFRNGIIKPGIHRSSFGGAMRSVPGRENEDSQGMYEEIVSIPGRIKNRRHPTEKPREFSHMFARIVGGNDRKTLDPFCGSGNLLDAFSNSVGIDVVDYQPKGGIETFL